MSACLSKALNVQSEADIDEMRPLKLGPFELGSEAARVAINIIRDGKYDKQIKIFDLVSNNSQESFQPMYWLLHHETYGDGEFFVFHPDAISGMPTSVEEAVVRAISVANDIERQRIYNGNIGVFIGDKKISDIFGCVLTAMSSSRSLEGSLLVRSREIIIMDILGEQSNKNSISYLVGSFFTSPEKFRFLEFYRIIEARFLEDVKKKFLDDFSKGPGDALKNAERTLKSELNQIINLSELAKDEFEWCWVKIDQLRNSNQFAASLFRKLERKLTERGGKSKEGAALIYQIRCAIVHGSNKDIIFDGFPDGNKVIEAVMPYVERAALSLIGINPIKN